MTLGQKIKKLRTENGLTQKDLADQVYVTFQTVSKWENDENEPDVSTLRELAKIFNCSLNYLLSEDEGEEKKIVSPQPSPAPAPAPVTTQTVVIHQMSQHTCAKCGKGIPENELEIRRVAHTHRQGRRNTTTYTESYYHKDCLQQIREADAERERVNAAYKAKKAKKLSFGWGIAGGVVSFVITLLILLLVEECRAVIHPALSVAIALGVGYGIFAMIYCIITGSYIGEVFVWCSTRSIRIPGVIFSWDIDGAMAAIMLKIALSVFGFLLGLFFLAFAIAFSATLSMFSFPFILIHNINNNYADAL